MSKAKNNSVAEALKKVLADTYALYLKTQNYHWNVEGENFKTLHLMFEEQYNALALNIDETAELIRAIKVKAPGSFEYFSKNTKIKPADFDKKSGEMVKDLLTDNEKICDTLQQCLEIAQKNGDEVIVDNMINRMREHRKTAWMLRSSL